MQGKVSHFALGLALSMGAAIPAQAQPAFAGSALIAPSAVYSAVSAACNAASPIAQTALAPASQSKSAAILGGSVSKLELMRMQQNSAAETTLADTTGSASSALAASQTLQPALGAARPSLQFCQSQSGDSRALAEVRQRPAELSNAVYTREDFLASKRVTIGRTMFDTEWNRVRNQGLSQGAFERYVGQRPAAGVALLEQVNSWTNHRIRYVEDKDLYGKADYWAEAGTTLTRKRGDCEDIAIVKMQLLAAAGVRREDMFLTIARDLTRRADHAVLIVRTDQGYFLLDNSVDRVLDASASYDYRPVVSFNDKTAWLHGY